MSNINITYLEKIIHEMNTPLQNLGMIPDLMLDSNIIMSKADQQESLNCIQTSAIKLQQLVCMLSSITNLASDQIKLKIETTDLVKLIDNEVKYHALHAKRDTAKKIELVFNAKIDVCNTKVDSFWFRQLIANLVINAINHSEKGIIEISLDVIHKKGKDNIILKVMDEGYGIPEPELEEIFIPLKRGSHSIGKVKGSGIGLAVSQEIVESHGGLIHAKNNSKDGATFEVNLPLKN